MGLETINVPMVDGKIRQVRGLVLWGEVAGVRHALLAENPAEESGLLTHYESGQVLTRITSDDLDNAERSYPGRAGMFRRAALFALRRVVERVGEAKFNETLAAAPRINRKKRRS
jgi:hypothetical protein